MNKNAIKQIAHTLMPQHTAVLHADMHRHDVANLLTGSANIGVELGVATGIFSQRMVTSGKFAQFFGVDVYEDTHDTAEYKEALIRIGIYQPYKLLRMRFDEARELFEDDSLDFIYIDGYAHTGEDGGTTLSDWYAKLKVGGIMAGDDYHEDWPLVQWAVNDFAQQRGITLHVAGKTEEDSVYSRYPTWFFTKTETSIGKVFAPHPRLVQIGASERRRVYWLRLRKTFARTLLKKLGYTCAS